MVAAAGCDLIDCISHGRIQVDQAGTTVPKYRWKIIHVILGGAGDVKTILSSILGKLINDAYIPCLGDDQFGGKLYNWRLSTGVLI